MCNCSGCNLALSSLSGAQEVAKFCLIPKCAPDWELGAYWEEVLIKRVETVKCCSCVLKMALRVRGFSS